MPHEAMNILERLQAFLGIRSPIASLMAPIVGLFRIGAMSEAIGLSNEPKTELRKAHES